MWSRLRLSPFWAGSGRKSSSRSLSFESHQWKIKVLGHRHHGRASYSQGSSILDSDELSMYPWWLRVNKRVYSSTSDVSDIPLSKVSWLQIKHILSTHKDMMPLDPQASKHSILLAAFSSSDPISGVSSHVQSQGPPWLPGPKEEWENEKSPSSGGPWESN